MNTNLLIYLAIAVVLIAQAATIYIVRHLVRKWCTDVFVAGHRAGIETSEPFAESYRLGYDIGFEAGSKVDR